MRASFFFFFLSVSVLAPGCSDGTRSDADAGGSIDAAAAIDADERDGGAPGDAGAEDTGTGDDGGSAIDAGPPVDAGPPCTETMPGSCPGTLECLGCPTGPISERYLCTTACTSDAQCTDAARPVCNRDTTPGGSGEGICTAAGVVCTWGVRCAAPDTMIATPSGERRIDELREGDLVWSADGLGMIAVPLVMVSRTPALDHRVVRVVLATGRTLEISPGHPTADGRTFADLRARDTLDGVAIVSAEIVPYVHAFTYDVLPASDTGTYVAGGARIGSTLF